MEYAYINARVRSMKSQLLTPEAMEHLVTRPDLESVIAELQKTVYREELERASVRFSGIEMVDTALRNEMVRTLRKLLWMARGQEEEDWHIGFLIGRWDIHNIKTILRGKNIASIPEEILDCIVPAGVLDEAACIELTKQPDVKSVIDLLATWGIEAALPLTRHFSEFVEKKDMSVLEYALDRYYYEHAVELLRKGETEDDEILLEFLGTEIDTINIRTVLRVVRDRMRPEEVEGFFVRGGRSLDTAKLLSLASLPTLEAVVKGLEGTPYGGLGGVSERFFAEGRISEFEKELDRFLIRKALGLFLKDPLSIAIPLAFLWAKDVEFRNIRLIARGKAGEMTEKELREGLIHV